MNEFKKLLKGLDEEGLTQLTAKLMREGCWEPVADAVMEACNQLGGEGMEDAVYDRAWGMAYGY